LKSISSILVEIKVLECNIRLVVVESKYLKDV